MNALQQVVRDANNHLIETKREVMETKQEVKETKQEVKETREEMHKKFNALEKTIGSIVKDETVKKVISDNENLSILLSAISFGMSTTSKYIPFFNFMYDPEEENKQVYMVIHQGMLGCLKVFDSILGTHTLNKRFVHIIGSTLSLMGPETHKSDAFYEAAKKIFPAVHYSSVGCNKSKIFIFKVETIGSYLKEVIANPNSPISIDEKTQQDALDLFNKVSILSKSTTNKNGKHCFKTIIKFKKKSLTQIRPQHAIGPNIDTFIEYIVLQDLDLNYLSFQKHIGIDASLNFFTPAFMDGLNYMRSLFKMEPIETPCHISFGWKKDPNTTLKGFCDVIADFFNLSFEEIGNKCQLFITSHMNLTKDKVTKDLLDDEDSGSDTDIMCDESESESESDTPSPCVKRKLRSQIDSSKRKKTRSQV